MIFNSFPKGGGELFLWNVLLMAVIPKAYGYGVERLLEAGGNGTQSILWSMWVSLTHQTSTAVLNKYHNLMPVSKGFRHNGLFA